MIKWSIPEGAVKKVTDESGIVIWSGLKELITGTLTLRPSADISVGHTLYPADSTSAYLLINEEVSDGASTYIYSSTQNVIVSKFRLSGSPEHKITKITSVSVVGDPWSSSTGDTYNRFTLCVNGEEVYSATHTTTKDFDIAFVGATQINNYLADNGELPTIDLIYESKAVIDGSKNRSCGLTQVYVVLAYEGY